MIRMACAMAAVIGLSMIQPLAAQDQEVPQERVMKVVRMVEGGDLGAALECEMGFFGDPLAFDELTSAGISCAFGSGTFDVQLELKDGELPEGVERRVMEDLLNQLQEKVKIEKE